ncbi:hypothetical protein C8F04DRAFT_1082348 [Mycena alexandri]|uniref:Uncharacterized protein n=1 Tax=Mycena alexandri TaxID=1745969 RepID=A0AAD6X8R1_9AGAR|nr:hypothetical protein C8F04DRAFT_1082348 [Mycena alexandri]
MTTDWIVRKQLVQTEANIVEIQKHLELLDDLQTLVLRQFAVVTTFLVLTSPVEITQEIFIQCFPFDQCICICRLRQTKSNFPHCLAFVTTGETLRALHSGTVANHVPLLSFAEHWEQCRLETRRLGRSKRTLNDGLTLVSPLDWIPGGPNTQKSVQPIGVDTIQPLFHHPIEINQHTTRIT